MNFKQIKYLIYQNWSLYARISLSLGGNEKFKIPRVYLIIPFLLYLGYFAHSIDGLITLWILFIWSLLILEMGKVFNNGYFDLIHFFYLNGSYKRKLTNLILMELFGIKFFSFILFGIISVVGSSKFVAFTILVFLYCIFNVLFVFVIIIGNRIRTTSIIYQWALILIFSFLFGFSGISPTNTEVIFEMHLTFQNWIDANFVLTLSFLILILVVVYYMGSLFTKQVYEQKPFINPASFP